MVTSISSSVPELPDARTVVEVLRWRAEHHGERVACTVLTDGESAESHLTYAELDAQASAVGSALAAAGARGERTLLLLPPGLDFVKAFFGCLYAGATAVPFYPPRPRHSNSHLSAVITDARPLFALVTSEIRERLVSEECCSALQTIAVNEIEPANRPELWKASISEDDLAYLQYTSGSTRQPRGVTVRHGQLLRHTGMIWRALEQNEHSVIVSWLPLFHDMGLVGTLVTPLVFGTRTILMSPGHFLMKPVRWLQCMSRYRATSTGAPNFAYDLCVERTTVEDRQDLDLSNWTMAFSGAEPVRARTIERFAATFAPCGFRVEAFYPCYGLAEATLLVTGGTKASPPVITRFTQTSREDKRVAYASRESGDEFTLVGCGRSQSNQRVLIVDPDSHVPCRDFEIGEIWVAGPTISTKYWNEATADNDVFNARTADGNGPFLRTGDLGFLVDGELYITGRLKNLLIIRGQNYHAHDIEYAVQMSHPSLAVTRGAVFTIERDDSEDLIVVQELPRSFHQNDAESVVAAIRRTLAVDFGLNAQSIVLVRFGTIPKTSSGKTMRYVCRELFLNRQLRTIATFEEVKAATHNSETDVEGGGDYNKLLHWVRSSVADKLSIDYVSIDPNQAFAEYGLSSLQIAELAGNLEKHLGREISPSLLYAYPTLDLLVKHLTKTIEAGPPAAAPITLQSGEPIAIVGLACRFPGASDAEAFWELLREGCEGISEVPSDRWNADLYYDPTLLRPGSMNTRWGGFLSEVDTFDSEFFRISSVEADSMDPQQRLLLEVAWEALEDAGLPLERVKGTQTGVFVGISTNDYSRAISSDRARTDIFWCTSNALSIAANRISYFLDVHGPSIAVDTACSSSLTALHLACQSLRKGESEIALVGGVNVMLLPDITINMSQAGATSADGRCKAFDASADGLVRGEGAGVVILKPLHKALEDGDRVYAVVRGTAVNQDGATNGLTAPNPKAQVNVVRAAYSDAGVSPYSVQYVETHGPGTPLGDPIELGALAQVVSGSQRSEVCRVGSVKTNIGHLEAAAGIAALIKVALALKHGQIPPSLHFQLPNPRIPFNDLKLSVSTRLEAWPLLAEGVRRAGVSAFGFGGTNVHVVIDSVESTERAAIIDNSPTEPFHVLPLSAPNKKALGVLAGTYRDYLNKQIATSEEHETLALASIALAAGERRTRHRQRLAVVGRSPEEIVNHLNGFLHETPHRLVHWGEALDLRDRGPVFVFSGLETANKSLRHELLKHAAFRDQVDCCDDVTRRVAGWSVAQAFSQSASPEGELDEGLSCSQMALFTLQVSLAALWRQWGVEPAAVIGHSAGEVAAAYVSGVLNLSEALTVLHQRSMLLEEHLRRSSGQGKMAAVRLSLEETRSHLSRYGEGIEIAAHNGPALTICAGEQEALTRFLATLNKRDVLSRVLDIPGPGHTSFVEPLQEKLITALPTLKPGPAQVTFFSTVTGKQCEGTSLGVEHWGHHIREPVAFAEAVEASIASGHRLFLELGTQGALSPCIAGSLRVAAERGIAIPSLREQQSAGEALACAVAQLYVSGYPVIWRKQYPNTPWVPLPKYPWQHKHHWIPANNTAPNWVELQRHPFLGARLPVAPPAACWHREIGPADCTWLRDHLVGDMALIPTTAYLKLAFDAAREILSTSDLLLEDVELEQGVFIPAGETRMLQTNFGRDAGGAWRFEVHTAKPAAAADTSGWTRAASGRVRRATSEPEDHLPKLEVIRSNGLVALNPATLRDAFAQHGIVYGTTFSRIDALWQANDGAALAHVVALDAAEENGFFAPGVLDACLQPMALTLSNIESQTTAIAPGYLPVRVERVRINGQLPASSWSYVRRRATASAAEPFCADAVIFAEDGQVMAEVCGFLVGATAPGRTNNAPPLRMSWPICAVTSPRRRSGKWIILSVNSGLGLCLQHRLQDSGVLVQSVDTIEKLRAALAERGEIAGVVDLRSIEAHLAADASGTKIARRVAETCSAALDAVRVLVAASEGASIPLWLVTSGGVPISDDERPSALQHPLWSLARTIVAEEPRVWGGIVDIDPGASEEENAQSLFAALVEGDEEDQIAFRQGRRHVARLAPIEQELSHKTELIVRSDGTYLITGGLGDLGLQVARWLVQNGARRLILLGRRGLPPRERWRELDVNGAERKVIEAILELEARGTSVHLAQVDVSSEAEVRTYLDAFRRQAWPEIRGVLHLAGTVGLTPLLEIDQQTLVEHFAPKVAGAWNLHRYFADRKLDFFVLFSSGSALLGSPGIGAYGAANAFLDALASMRRADGLAGLSINWGFWRESGMAARVLQQAPDRPAPRGMLGLSNREALDILGRLISCEYPSLAAMPFDWHEWTKAHPASAARPYLRLLATAVSETTDNITGISRAELLRAPATDRKSIVETYLRRRLSRLLEIDPVRLEEDQQLTYLGIDSLMAVELKNRIEAELQISIPIVSLLQGPSIAQLANFIVERVSATPAPDTVEKQPMAQQLSEEDAKRLLADLDQLPPSTVTALIDSFAGKAKDEA